jgi:uncharacterized membrane protein
VGAEIDGSAKHLLPDPDSEVPAPKPRPDGEGAALRLRCEGYLQALDHSALVAAACEAEAVVELDVKPGHLMMAGVAIGKVWPPDACTEELVTAVEQGILVGRERTSVQDIEFSIRQMVEVGARALSPGVNDPYTALVTIDRLSRSLAHIMSRRPARSQWCDDDDALRLIVNPPRFDGLVDASFNMLRQYGEGSAAVLIRLAERLSDLHQIADDRQRVTIRRHLDMVIRAGRRSLKEPNDLAALEQRDPAGAR